MIDVLWCSHNLWILWLRARCTLQLYKDIFGGGNESDAMDEVTCFSGASVTTLH